MENHFNDEIIDLTGSATPVTRTFLNSNSVICLDSDDSFNVSFESNKKSTNNKKVTNNKLLESFVTPMQKRKQKEKNFDFGTCPICFEVLGVNPLVATICGHVYCSECLKQALLREKRCPTCRNCLKGKSSHHPLYLGR